MNLRPALFLVILCLSVFSVLAAPDLPKAAAQSPAPWSTTTNIPAGGSNGQAPTCVLSAGYLFCITDNGTAVYGQETAGVVSTWHTSPNSYKNGGDPMIIPPNCVVYDGYMDCVGGADTGHNNIIATYYSQISSSGFSAWTSSSNYILAITITQCVISGATVLCIEGLSEPSGAFNVYFSATSTASATGGFGAWTQTFEAGPGGGTTAGSSPCFGVGFLGTGYAVIGSYVYMVGGSFGLIGGSCTSNKWAYDTFAGATATGAGGAVAWTNATSTFPVSIAYIAGCQDYGGELICEGGLPSTGCPCTGIEYLEGSNLANPNGVWATDSTSLHTGYTALGNSCVTDGSTLLECIGAGATNKVVQYSGGSVISVIIQSQPRNVLNGLIIDGTVYSTTTTFTWTINSVHNITAALNAGGAYGLSWTKWSIGGGRSQSYTVTGSATLTAYFAPNTCLQPTAILKFEAGCWLPAVVQYYSQPLGTPLFLGLIVGNVDMAVFIKTRNAVIAAVLFTIAVSVLGYALPGVFTEIAYGTLALTVAGLVYKVATLRS